MNRRKLIQGAAAVTAAPFAAQQSFETLMQRIGRDVIGAGLDSTDMHARQSAHFPGNMNDFIDQVLGVSLWEKQREIVDALEVHPRITVRSSHAIGKSFVAARIVLAYLHTHPNSVVITTAPSYSQVRNILWRYIRSAIETSREPLLGRSLLLEYQIAPDWYAMGFKGDDRNEHIMQGFHSSNLLFVVDEAAGVHELVMRASEAILTGEGARLLLIGNPTSMSGAFRRSFHQDSHLYHTITVSAYDTPNFTTFGITRDDMLNGEWERKITGHELPMPGLVDPFWVNRQIQLFGPDSPYVQTRVDAQFADDDENTLIALSQIEANEKDPASPDAIAPVIAGADIARSGNDENALCIRQGRVERRLVAWRGMDLMQTVGRIRRELEPYGGRLVKEIRIDVIGLGAGVADRLRELGYNAIDVNVSVSASDKEKWPIFRHEAWWQMKQLYESGGIVPERGREFDEILKAQMSDVRYFYSGSRHTMPAIESKDATKARTGHSPDRAEAQMLAYCTLPPVKKQPATALAMGRSRGRW